MLKRRIYSIRNVRVESEQTHKSWENTNLIFFLMDTIPFTFFYFFTSNFVSRKMKKRKQIELTQALDLYLARQEI